MSKNFDSPIEVGFCGATPMETIDYRSRTRDHEGNLLEGVEPVAVPVASEHQRGFNEGIDAAAAFLRSKYGVQGWDCLDFARALHDLKRFPEAPNGG